MPAVSGALTAIGIGKESVWGTAVTATDLIPVDEFEAEGVEPRAEEMTIRGDMRAMLWNTYQTTEHAEIKLSGPFYPGDAASGGMGHFLMGLFGTDSLAAGTAHSFSVSASTYPGVPSFTVVDYNNAEGSGTAHAFPGMRVNTLTLKYTPDDFLQCEVEMIGKSFAAVAKPTLTAPTAAPLLGAASFLNIAGGTVTVYEEFSIEFDRGAEAIYTLSGTGAANLAPIDVRVNPPMAKFSGKALFADMAEANRFYNHSRSSIVIATRTAAPILTITATSPSWDAAKPTRSADDLIRIEMEGVFAFSSVDGGICKPVLTNARATSY